MDNEYLKRIYGLLESGATLGTGAASGLVGLPYGLYKGVTSGAYGTPEAPRIAAREAQQFMERNTYQPRTEQGQENIRQLAGLLEATKLPPVMPEASLLAAIPKQAYAAQAERAGMAAEKAIAPVVTRTMERGGLPAQLLGDLSQGSIRPMDVWHGSTNKELTQLNPKKSFGNLGVSWVSPEEEFAKRYAGKEGKVYKLDLNEGKNFDFANQEHLNLLKEKTKSVDIYDPIRGVMTLDKKVPDSGSYYSAEDPQLFNAIKKMGFDTVSVYEDGVRNIGVFNPKKNIKFIDESSDAGLLGQSKAASAFDVSRRDASDIFGAGAERVVYKDPQSGGTMEVLAKPDGTASVLSLEVPETSRGKGIGQSLQAQVMQDFPEMMGQVSSKAAAKTAYRLGRRPPFKPDATLEDVYKMMDEDSSVNLVSPEMQKRFRQSLLD